MPIRRPSLRDPDAVLAGLRRLPAARPLLDEVRPQDDVWLVGGAVRDLLLGVEPHELDLVTTGSVDDLAARLGPVVARHERFGTVTVEPRTGVRYDVARARRERYAAPGALPDVEPVAAVEEDLGRRDVTINAIAVRLPDGRVAQVPGALDDLAQGRLRVQHDRSLVDDPTRVWRIARYAARLRFDIDPRTRVLAGDADATTISGARHGSELRLLLAEPDPAAAFAVLLDLNERFLPRGFAASPPGLDAALALLPPGGRRDLVRLAASCAGVGLEHLMPWLDAIALTAAERDIVGAGSRASTLGPLRAARTPSEIRRAAAGAPDEVVALAGGPNAARWFRTVRDARLAIDGHDLLEAGVPAGPELGERLQRALDAKLDGRLDPSLEARDAELAVALADREATP